MDSVIMLYGRTLISKVASLSFQKRKELIKYISPDTDIEKLIEINVDFRSLDTIRIIANTSYKSWHTEPPDHVFKIKRANIDAISFIDILTVHG